MLAQVNHTPVPYWCGLPLAELRRWITASNRIVEERRRAEDEARRRLAGNKGVYKR